MPIRQNVEHTSRATSHIVWLIKNFPNVHAINCDLTPSFNMLLSGFEKLEDAERQNMAEANTRARLRMVTLYYYASLKGCLVLGTGNKVEDFGIQFFTKFGDGACDLSPIGDLMKSEVRKLGEYMGISNEIINAVPSDGLLGDDRTDEKQITATYNELEAAMNWLEDNKFGTVEGIIEFSKLTERQREVILIYSKRNFANKHKMQKPPVCNLDYLRK